MAIQNELRKYLNYEFSSDPYTGTDYKTFEKKYINYLKKMCAHYGWTVEKVSKNHYEFSAFIKNVNGHLVYLAIPDVRHFPGYWFEKILVRTAKHERDYSGGSNKCTDLPHLDVALRGLFDQQRVVNT